MKQLQLQAFGPTHEAVACIEVAEPGPPAAGEVLVQVEACSINPADLLSGDPCHLGADKAIFRDVRLHGFWLARTLRAMDGPAIHALYQELAARLADGTLGVPVEAEYRLEDHTQALRHAARAGRDGKVIFTPAG